MIKRLKIANALLPDHPRVLHLLGWATFMNGDPGLGRKFLCLALKKLPRDVQIICDLAVLENQQGNSKIAMEYATMAIRIAPKNPMAQEVLMVTNAFNKMRGKLEDKVN